MRLLDDECLSGLMLEALRREGHDVIWAAKTAPGDVDVDVLARSVREGLILVTADRGFGELVVRQKRPAVGIVVSVLASTKADLAASAKEIAARVSQLGEDGLTGWLTIIEADRTRQRALPAPGDRA